MKANFMLPSGSYNVALSEKDIQRLLKSGILSLRLSRIPCVTGRAVYDPKKKDLVTLDKKEVCNNLQFQLDEPVADLDGGFWPVQFMNIVLTHEKEEKNDERTRNADPT